MSKFVVNPNEYIFFEPDQVLTNDHLNQLFGYLDQQERWTRNKLIGMGIVCGFELSYNRKAEAISISKGCGITSQGYLINQCKHHTYTHVINYTLKTLPKDLPFTCTDTPFYKPGTDPKLKIYQLLDANGVARMKPDPCADCLPPGNNQNPPAITNPPEPLSSVAGGLADYEVVLFLEVQEKDLKNCDTQDCNNKGEKMVFAIRALLLPRMFIKKGAGSEAAEVRLKRYNVPYTAIKNTEQVLEGFFKLMDKNTLARLEDALAYCYNYTAGFFPNTPKPPFLTIPGEYLHNEIESVIKHSPLLMQYCYDFINDLILAYYEFREAAQCVNLACCADECRFPLHLVLGIAGTDTDKTGRDPNRQYFMKAVGGCENSELSKLEFLLKRIEMLIKQFFNPYTEWRKMIVREVLTDRELIPVKITPSQYEKFPLSERAIPYYYLMDTAEKNLYKYWNFHKSVNGNGAFNLSYNAKVYNYDESVTDPLLFDIEQNNFLRIEGHIGQPYKTMLAEISLLREAYNLPFDVVAVSADMLNPLGKLPECHMQDLETDYRLIVSDFACKVHGSFCLLAQLPFPADDKHQQPYPGANKYVTPADKLPAPLVFGKANYKKGDFLKTFCNPAKGAKTIGAEYLELLNKEKEFVELITKYITESTQSGDTTLAAVYTYYQAVFYFIDAVERLMVILMTESIATLDIEKADSKFTAAYFNYLYRLGIVSAEPLAVTEDADGTPSNSVLIAIDYAIAQTVVLANACVDETLQTLKNEYLTRLRNYEQQLYFLNYFKKHPGLEHKGGVPKGGTFVLVYHEEEYNVWTVEKERGEAVKVTSTLSEVSLDRAQIETFLEYVNKCGKSTVSLGPIYKIFNPPPREKYEIPNGAVIADFYVPYMCCSDCAPVAYVIQPVDNRPAIYNVIGGGSRCENSDEKGYTVGLNHSEVDVSYQLYFTAEKLDAPDVKEDTVKLGAAVKGNGRPIDFGIKTRPGKYTVIAINKATGLSSNMRGSATIAMSAAPQIFSMASTNTPYNGEYVIVLEGSELKVSYQLKNSESEIDVPAMEGTGNKLVFPAQQSPGTYTITATSADNCESQMEGSLTIPNAPVPK